MARGGGQIGFEHVTPLSDVAGGALEEWRGAQRAIGDALLFPVIENPSKPCDRRHFFGWWYEADERASVEHVKGRAFHSLRRAWATDVKHVPLKDLAHLGGRKDPATILKCYQQPDEQTMRGALAGCQQRRAVSVGKR